MTKEQIKQKADMYIKDFHNTELSATDLILFAEQLISEATKELEAQIEQLVYFHNEDVNTIKLLNEQIAELEQKISVLLSCKNCPENKGGFICQKEYEDKCLAQKIQYIKELKEENAELKKVAEFQQSSNMSRHFENKKLKEVLAVDSTFNKALNSMNKSLEEERDKYRNMVFDKDEQLTKAKEIIHKVCYEFGIYDKDFMEKAKQFLKE